MPEVRQTDIEVVNPSTVHQRIEAAHRQASCEVTAEEWAVDVRVGETATQMGDDSRLWWPVTYEVKRLDEA